MFCYRQAFWLLVVMLTSGQMAMASEPLAISFPQVLQRVVDTYPSLRIARLQVQRASQNVARVESALGWNLNGKAGINRDVTILTTPSDVADLSASFSRLLKSGNSLGISGAYQYEDSTLSFSPVLPNPSHRTWIDLNYRMALGKGKDNPEYQQGLQTAQASVIVEKANQYAVRDNLARQTMELFYRAAEIHTSLKTAQSAVDRALRLKKYINGRLSLGLSEKKDVLQADAQYRARLSDVKSLQVSWQQVRTTLNRLMGRPWDEEFVPDLQGVKLASNMVGDLDGYASEAEKNSPDLLRNEARILTSEADIALGLDRRKNTVDLVFSVGTRTSAGDASGGYVNEQDLAGGVRLDYQQAFDKRGFDALIYQAKIDKRAAEEDSAMVRDNLRYSVASLLAELDANKVALKSHKQRVKSENLKFEEALERYQEGRTETDHLIQYENEYQVAKFELDNQKIAFERRYYDLNILRGQIWNIVSLPDNLE